ncbi:hypothetical protein GCM10023189_31790 [Nibrella saemangeumensis]|uniref:Glycosyl transferase family 1 domain-containing protein n=1 Tax=Nibrella saemangeumensis TaxID=1084526 RepID=A0ABP8N3S0_9BACT
MALSKPKLLIFIEYYLPGYKFGGPTQSVANLVALLKDRYDIYVVTRDRDYGDQQPYTTIRPDEWLNQNGYQIIYLSPARTGIRDIHRIIRSQSFAFIYTNSLFAGFSRQLLLLTVFPRQRIIVAPRGELHTGALRLKAYKKLPFVYLVKLLPASVIVWHATDEEEVNSIKRVFPQATVRLAGVNVAPVSSAGSRKLQGNDKEAGRLKLVFVSRLTTKKNLKFLLERLRTVTEGVVELDIYGPIVDIPYWHECEDVIRELPAHCLVTYKGTLSHDRVADVLSRYDFFVLPTLGENFGHAIFEALSAGLPVLLSDQTPWRNLESRQAGWDLPLQAQSWTETLKNCIAMGSEQYLAWSEQAEQVAREYVREEAFEEKYRALFS